MTAFIFINLSISDCEKHYFTKFNEITKAKQKGIPEQHHSKCGEREKSVSFNVILYSKMLKPQLRRSIKFFLGIKFRYLQIVTCNF
jgi:hypothetical protein